MAKVSVGQFIAQVRQEASKVVWPTRRETVVTTIMVLVLTAVVALFFSIVDFGVFTLVDMLLALRF